MRDERGSMLPAFAGLLFVSFVLITLSVEIALLGATYRDTANLADVAAEAGASMIDQGALHEGTTTIDPRAAASEAVATVARAGISAAETVVEVRGATVCVSITRRHATFGLRYLAISEIVIDVSGCAEPGTG